MELTDLLDKIEVVSFSLVDICRKVRSVQGAVQPTVPRNDLNIPRQKAGLISLSVIAAGLACTVPVDRCCS